MKARVYFFLVILTLMSLPVYTQAQHYFNIIALGVEGGINEGDLSAYLVAAKGSSDFILLDAGTLVNGLEKSSTRDSLKKLGISANSKEELAGHMLNKNIRAYLISHAHLDHIAGLVIASPDDSKKVVFGTEDSINDLKNFIFNWKIWPNFADQGVDPKLGKYSYVRLTPDQFFDIPKTTLTVRAFPLSHDKVSSTAFLIRSQQDAYILYLGDTGADILEHSHHLKKVWQAIVPLIKEKKLKGIFIESSYPNDQPDAKLFGHLKPKWLLSELRELAKLVNEDNPQAALQKFKILVTHIKPSLEGKDPIKEIRKELNDGNNLGVDFIILRQGEGVRL